jgi:hypothetical protein
MAKLRATDRDAGNLLRTAITPDMNPESLVRPALSGSVNSIDWRRTPSVGFYKASKQNGPGGRSPSPSGLELRRVRWAKE